MKTRIEQEVQLINKDNLAQLNDRVTDLTRETTDKGVRINRLQGDYESLQEEFKRYRSEKAYQEE